MTPGKCRHCSNDLVEYDGIIMCKTWAEGTEAVIRSMVDSLQQAIDAELIAHIESELGVRNE